MVNTNLLADILVLNKNINIYFPIIFILISLAKILCSNLTYILFVIIWYTQLVVEVNPQRIYYHVNLIYLALFTSVKQDCLKIRE
jgi:hypothetical protein